MNSMETPNQSKSVLFINKLPDPILDSELHDFFADYKDNIVMIQIERTHKTYDIFNTRKPKATIIFRDPAKAKEAREALNMKRLKGKALNIMWHEKDNSVRYNNTANVFVKGIGDAKPREVYELFSKYGEIISTKICEDEDGNLHGYGYINYYNLESAEKAIKELNGKKMWGHTLELEHFQKKSERLENTMGNNGIYVKNIPNKISEGELKDLFSKYGQITWSKMFKDPNERKYAIFVYSDPETANKAKEEMNDHKVNPKDEVGLYVDLLQKKQERKRLLTSKIGDINNKLNQEFKNCNLYIKNLPLSLTEEQLGNIFSKYGEVKSVKISKYLLETEVGGKKKEIETSRGFGFVCFTQEEFAKKAMDELNEKNLPGFETSKRPVIINLFMPRIERKQFLTKIQSTTPNSRFQFAMNAPYPPMPYGMPPNYNMYQQRPHNRHPNQPFRKPPQHQNFQKIPPQQIQQTPQKEDEPNIETLKSLGTVEAKKDYLGEYLFKKIESHQIAQEKNFTIDTISRITGMILGIDDIQEIFDITTNYLSLTTRIKEALSLLDSSR